MDYKKLYIKGLKFNKEGKYAKAIREFDKIIRKHPNDADAYSDRGVSKFHLNDLQGALDDMNQSVILEPTNPYRYASRAFIRERNGDIEGAIVDYRKSIELDPENAISHNNLGLLEEKLGYLEMSRKRFQKADDIIGISQPPSKERELLNETQVLVDELLRELKIPVQGEPLRPTILKLIGQVFTSSKVRKEYFAFLRKLFERKS